MKFPADGKKMKKAAKKSHKWPPKRSVNDNDADDMKKKKKKVFAVKHSGSFQGKSNALGHGGRAAQMKAHGVPGGVIGAIARREGAAPGEKNYHDGKKKKK